jgi:hypothetical protein
MGKVDIQAFIQNTGDPTPTIDDSNFCSCTDPYNDMTSDQDILYPGVEFCWCADGSEAFYCGDGPYVAGAQWTVAMTNGITMDYYAGYATTKLVFKGTSEALQRFGELQPASSDPISLGTTDMVDSENNTFTKSGLATDETYTPIFDVETKPRVQSTSNSGNVEHTSSGQPIKQ